MIEIKIEKRLPVVQSGSCTGSTHGGEVHSIVQVYRTFRKLRLAWLKATASTLKRYANICDLK